jgi:hypothetical protein
MTEPQLTAIVDDFDLDGWIDGTCRYTVTAKVFQRGDLLTRLDDLKDQIDKAQKVPKEQRGANEVGPDKLIDEWESLAEELLASAMTVHVQDRTDERRRHIRDNLVKDKKLDLTKDDDTETVILHQIADSIVKIEANGKAKDFPDGFPPNKLRELKDRLGDAALSPLRDAFFKVISEAPTVSAPLSRNSSSSRGGGI